MFKACSCYIKECNELKETQSEEYFLTYEKKCVEKIFCFCHVTPMSPQRSSVNPIIKILVHDTPKRCIFIRVKLQLI